MSIPSLSELAKDLKPFVLSWLSSIAGGDGPFAPSPHDLSSAHHTGSLADAQAPQFLMLDGTRTLAGNLTVAGGVTIDGVDLSALAAVPFLTLSTTGELSSERVLTQGTDIVFTDGGAGGTLTISVGTGVVRTTRQVIAGSGLTGGGALSSDVTLNVGAGTLISVAADSVSLANGSAQYQVPVTGGSPFTPAWTALSTFAGTALNFGSGAFNLDVPGTLSVSTTNQAIDAHTHAITSSSNPGAAASLLASDAGGNLALVGLTLSGDLAVNGGDITASAGLNITPAAGDLKLNPSADVLLDPGGNDILPVTGYDLNLGSLTKKFLTLHAAELWVETLVAQNTIATIGGRILVAPTTTLIADLAAGGATMDVKHNQMQNGDRAVLQANGVAEWIAITSAPSAIAGGYRYSITRNLDGSGANAWSAGDAVVNTGTTGSGFIDLYSLESVNGIPLDYIYNFDTNGSVYSSNYAGASAWTIFGDGANTAVNDAVYFGCAGATWENLFYSIGTAAVYTATLVWEFWNGSAWTSFSPTTTDFKSTGYQSTTWTAASLTGWAANSVNGATAFWVRVRISAFTSWATQPTQSGRRVYRYKRQYGPTVTGWVRNSATFNDLSEHWAIGNLNGLYGYGADTFGVAVGKYSATTAWLGADAINGIRILRGSTALGQWQIDGDLFLGTDISAAATTNLAIFNAAQTYNGESVDVGDLLLGDNSASKANIFWDKSAGRLNFRGGTTVQAYIDTTGAVKAGAGNVTLDASGVSIVAPSADTTYLRFLDGANVVGSIWARSVSTDGVVIIEANGGNYRDDGYLYLRAEASTGHAVEIALVSFNATSGYVDISAYNGLVCDEGINVGGAVPIGTAGNANIAFSGVLKSYKNSTAYTGYIFVPLTTPLTSTSWDGDAYSDVASSTQLDLSAVFGAPAGIKAVLMQIITNDSAAWGTAGLYFACGPSSTYWHAAASRPAGGDVQNEQMALVPCDANGDVWYRINASGASTLDVYLRIWGYCI